ncbi:hypothetical protein LUZ60_000132 [Juncus effusus]|nr:hypothetical protein LUZ60_000132 [Juncus effusus]
MSSYQNVVGGKLKLKGKALDVKSSGLKKKKKKQKHYSDNEEIGKSDLPEGGSSGLATDPASDLTELPESEKQEGGPGLTELTGMTAAEKRYIEQKERIDRLRLAKTADKSHRDRISDFNQYLANLSEHYDIPKVGPG